MDTRTILINNEFIDIPAEKSCDCDVGFTDVLMTMQQEQKKMIIEHFKKFSPFFKSLESFETIDTI